MAEPSNAWVESYLEALLSHGLSKEYIGVRAAEGGAGAAAVSQALHTQDLHTQYYLRKIMATDQEGIVNAWQRAKAGTVMDAKEVRLEYTAWRVWSMQQMRNRKRLAGAETGDSSPESSPRSFSRHFDPIGEFTPLGQSYDMRAGAFLDRDVGLARCGMRGAAGNDLNVPLLQSNLTQLRIGQGRSGLDDPGQASPSTLSQATPAGHTLFAGRVDKLYIVLVSMHGLIRGDKMELGKDADTGGQVKYVVELAKNLALHPMVHRVDLLTRLIQDPKVDASYGVETEALAYGAGMHGGAFIVRIAAGDPKVYIPKEELWPHVREFADNALVHIKKLIRTMTRDAEPCDLYAVHGHYADGGEAAAMISHTLDVEMVLTGHSLGRNKLDHLLKSGTMTRKQIEETYKITRRMEGEERALDAAIMVLSSTQVEIDQQWGLYDGFDAKVANALRYRRRVGRHMPRMIVIPPGLEFSSYKVELPSDPMQLYIDYKNGMMDNSMTLFSHVTAGPDALLMDDAAPADLSDIVSGTLGAPASEPVPTKLMTSQLSKDLASVAIPRTKSRGTLSQSAQSARSSFRRNASHLSLVGLDHESTPDDPRIWKEIHRFLRNPRKPVVLAMSRPDAKKNITTLVKAFGSNPDLRNIANLVLIMGNRDCIDSLSKGSQTVLQQVLKLIDTHDLYGSVAYPKAHSQADISDIYKLATKTRGVFTNIALQEPFGLTLIEAAVHGAPIVATTHGGPVDIIRTLKNGKLVEPTDVDAIGQAILDILRDNVMWDTFSTNGVHNILAYSWPSHCIQYLEAIEKEKRHSVSSRRVVRHSWHDRMFEAAKVAGEPDDSDALQFGGGSPGKKLAMSLLKGETCEFSDDRATMQRVSCPTNTGGGEYSPTAGSTMNRNDVASQSAEILVFDDSAAQMARAPDGVPTCRLAARKRFAFAVLDNDADSPFLTSVLAAALQGRDESVGVGLLTVFTFSEVKDLLECHGFDPRSLDFVVCNAGAYIMCIDGRGEWHGDEAWEGKVLHHWDKQLVLRTLTRMTMSRAHVADPEGGGVITVLQRECATDVDDGNGPLHCLMDCTPKESTTMTAGDNALLLGHVQKHVRSRGIRCHLTLQLAPKPGGRALSILHATPLRGSRALALRHLAFAHSLSMAESTFLCTPASMKREVDGTLMGALCSDMVTLVEGSHKVVVIPVSRQVDEELAERNDTSTYERLKVSLAPFTSERVSFIDNVSDLVGSLSVE